jgi:hypothetical protein
VSARLDERTGMGPRSRGASVLVPVGVALVGVVLGWYGWGVCEPRLELLDRAPDDRSISSSAIRSPRPDRTDASCDDVEAEIERVVSARRDLQRHQKLRLAEASAAEGRDGWPSEIPSGVSPTEFEATLLTECERLGIEIEDVDCDQYPCFAVLDAATADPSFHALMNALEITCGEPLREYGAVSFNGQSPRYAVSCFPRADEDLQDAVRARAFDRLDVTP